LGAFSLDLQEMQEQFLLRVEATSGKPVILQSDSTFHGHATIKLAANDQPAHVLLFKPEQESVLPYLVAYQCEFALRTIEANHSAQFDLVATANMLPNLLELMQRDHQGKKDVPVSPAHQLSAEFLCLEPPGASEKNCRQGITPKSTAASSFWSNLGAYAQRCFSLSSAFPD
jgi:hypothetical protein